jgi:Fe2+ or Zn2+ uptake regulation protein
MAKGKSVADKRAIILGIFHEKKEPFLLKEIEKLASKKGVVLQSVQEILKTLTDDDLVKTDKIGTTNWFWSFVVGSGQKERGDGITSGEG